MTNAEMLEVTKIYSIAGMLPPGKPLIRLRPFRAPHHTISHAGLVGGGRIPRPGEITLDHRGVLFLYELPDHSAQALEDRVYLHTPALLSNVIYATHSRLVVGSNPTGPT
jgi:magnesium chelatase family protein